MSALRESGPESAANFVGYWLAPQARGRGVVTRAVARLGSHAFTRLDIHRLEIRAVAQNLPSRAVAERSGYLFEGILRDAYLLHGAYRDLALYAKLASDGEATLLPPAR